MSGAAAKPVTSPCIGVCRMHTSGLCEGCLRTIDEIMAWASHDEAARLAVMRLLPARRRAWRVRQVADRAAGEG